MRFLGCLILVWCVIPSLGCGEKKKAPTPAPPGPTAQNQPAKPTPVPPQTYPQSPPPPQPQQPKSLGQSVRAAAYRPERQNELRQIGLFFRQYELENNRNPRTEKEFIQYIQRDAGRIAQAIQDKYYILNLRVNLKGGAEGVIAWEYPTDGPGHMVVRVDASVTLMGVNDLKKALAGP